MREKLSERKVKRIVSIGYQFKPVYEDIEYLNIHVDDDEDEFLLQHLPSAITFIHEGLADPDNAAVLVHCAAGVSRSASVVIAYLMKTFTLDFDAAWKSLQETRPIVSPNVGFRYQLQLFAEMKYTLDNAHQQFKRMKIVAMAKEREMRGSLKKVDFGVDLSDNVDVYRCKKCRTVLASENNIVTHESGPGQTSFDWRKRSMMGSAFFGEDSEHKKPTVATEPCTSVFVEPMDWIQGIAEGQIEGQILCRKCDSKLGSFNWIGEFFNPPFPHPNNNIITTP
jgi:dual specificity phosphatase 12